MGGKKYDPANWRQSTRLVRGGTERSAFGETSEGLFLTSGYVYESAEEAEQAFKGEKQRYMYSRYANPTVTMFEKRLALLEGAETCVSTAPGMAAVFAALASQLKAGDRVVSSRALFGSCLYIIAEQLPKFGIETVLVDGIDLEEWKAALSTETQCVFLETPSNPVLEIIDIQTVSDLAHEAGAKIIVDNVFATPILQRPLELGADIVMYSATKHIDGQGRPLGGIEKALDRVDIDGPVMLSCGIGDSIVIVTRLRTVLFDPFLELCGNFSLRIDGIDRAKRNTCITIDAFIRIDDQHVRPFVKAIDGTYFHAVRELALDTSFNNNKCHVSELRDA